MYNYVYSGPFKEEIKEFLEYKKNKRESLYSAASYLHNFDQYTIKTNANNELSRELVEEWLVLRENESKRTLSVRATIIKSFAKYLNLIGKNAFVVNSGLYLYKSTYIPHIFTDNEVKCFFEQLEITVKTTKQFPYNKEQLKLFFKVLYCCGLRDSELLNLKYDDIDFTKRVLIIKNSKNNINRLIYLSDDLIHNFKIYIEKYSGNKTSQYVFYNAKTNNRRGIASICVEFHKIIESTNFDSNIRYRIHDFRHTFAVKNIKIAYEKGEDVYALMPILMTYMGHSHIKSTEYYLRFTPDVYEKVTKQFETRFENVIPKLIGGFYEE